MKSTLTFGGLLLSRNRQNRAYIGQELWAGVISTKRDQSLRSEGANYHEAVGHCLIPSLTLITTVSKSDPPEEEPSHNTEHPVKSRPLKNTPISLHLGKYEAPIPVLTP